MFVDNASCPTVEDILDELQAQRSLDFHLYRRTTIERRLSQRLAAVRAADFAAYLRLLRQDAGEVDRLVAHLTLKVTSFFRNPQVFTLLRSDVLPSLLATGSPIAVWSAGCATGEEVYSVAMDLADLADGRQDAKVDIVGTDVDQGALTAARAGRYAATAVTEMPGGFLERWFTMQPTDRGDFYIVSDALRRGVEFAWHNLVDAEGPPAPYSEAFDLILCRNVLIYFERPLQERVIALVFEALRPGGYLVLGEAESLPSNIERRCKCIDRRARIYQRIDHR